MCYVQFKQGLEFIIFDQSKRRYKLKVNKHWYGFDSELHNFRRAAGCNKFGLYLTME